MFLPLYCPVCLLAKQIIVFFPHNSNTHSSCIFYLLHMDVWGPYRTPIHSNAKYFLTIVDDFSRVTWIFLMQYKSDSFITIKHFLQMVQIQYHFVPKCIITDNRLEFFNKNCQDLFVSKDIVHQSSCAYTPQQNNIVERKRRHVLEVARALQFQANTPSHLWGYCVQVAIYLINRFSSSILKGLSPFEIFFW